MYHIECVQCQTRFTEDQTITRCLECGQALDVQFDMTKLKQTVNEYVLKNTPPSAMKYLNFYPIKDRSKLVSLNEGGTPLVHSQILSDKYGIQNLYIKNEGANPTGVFKDRGTLVEVTKAKEIDAKGIVLASTGNMAASVSAYAAKAGIPCYVLVPENTPVGKLSQSLIHGGKVIKIQGTYTDCCAMSEKMAQKYGFMLAGDYAFRSEGQKSIAFEIIEQLDWKVPDVVLAPVGCGTNLYGIAKGFFEWKELGIIDKIPRIIGVQPEKADTLYSAFYAGENAKRTIKYPTSLCSAVNIGAPLDDMKLLKAIRKSDGDFEIIDDNTVLEAQMNMAKLASVFTEPSGAIPVACLSKLIKNGKIKSDETVVCVATGTGLKDAHSASILFSNLPSVSADINEIDDFLNSGILNLQEKKEGEEIVFSIKPDEKEIMRIVTKKYDFPVEQNKNLFSQLCEEIGLFFERKKEMRHAELQILIEDTLANFHTDERKNQQVFEIIDFNSHNSLNAKATASVHIRFQGEDLKGEGEGTGAVDATISTIEKLIKEKTDFHIELKNYSVDIPSEGVNAVVRVKIMFADSDGNTVHVMGVSSDVVVASLLAYEKGFLRLWKG